MRIACAALAALAAACVLTPSVGASSVTRAQLASLARQAAADPGMLASLRAVDRIDGQSADLAAALDARGDALRARLHMLAATAGASAQPRISQPRAAARAILSGRRFRGSSVPRPLHRPLSWIGGELHRFGRTLRRAYESISARLPGGGDVFWLLVGGLVAAVAALVAVRLGRRRAGRLVQGYARAASLGADDPRLLEREADESERRGDYERTLRLRFQAGLLRLAHAQAVPAQASLTNGEIARRLDSASFRRIAADFDQVVYGGRVASGEDAARSRSGWQRVLEETRSR